MEAKVPWLWYANVIIANVIINIYMALNKHQAKMTVQYLHRKYDRLIDKNRIAKLDTVDLLQ